MTMSKAEAAARAASPLLAERGKTHGSWDRNSQAIADLRRAVAENQSEFLPPAVDEAINMILVKIARAITGDHTFAEHPKDIGGYAGLWEAWCNSLHGEEAPAPKVPASIEDDIREILSGENFSIREVEMLTRQISDVLLSHAVLRPVTDTCGCEEGPSTLSAADIDYDTNNCGYIGQMPDGTHFNVKIWNSNLNIAKARLVDVMKILCPPGDTNTLTAEEKIEQLENFVTELEGALEREKAARIHAYHMNEERVKEMWFKGIERAHENMRAKKKAEEDANALNPKPFNVTVEGIKSILSTNPNLNDDMVSITITMR